jgi:hypothetical protein
MDVDAAKLNALEEELSEVKDLLHLTIDSLKQTQIYLVRLAKNQADLTHRISKWPYIAVDSNQPPKEEGTPSE